MNNNHKQAIIYSIILKPVGSYCNLKCIYCYYKSHQKKDLISENILDRIIFDLCKYSSVIGCPISINWHGGEPLLSGLNFFKKVIRIEEKYKKEFNVLQISNKVQTNGTLIDKEWCTFFKDNDFKVGLSFDLIEQPHNYYRSNSFTKVSKAIEILHQYSIDFASITVCTESLMKYSSKVIFNSLLKFGIKRFDFQSQSDSNGSIAAYNKLFSTFMMKMIDQYFSINNPQLHFRFVNAVIDKIIKSNNSILCKLDRNSCGRFPSIDNHGNFYICDNYDNRLFSGNPLSNITKSDIPTIINSSGYNVLRNVMRSNISSECINCKVFDICGGGCPNDYNNYNDKNILCNAYKNIFTYLKSRVSQIIRKQQCLNG